VRRLVACGAVLAIAAAAVALASSVAVAHRAARHMVQDSEEASGLDPRSIEIAAHGMRSIRTSDFSGSAPSPSVKKILPDTGPPDPMLAVGPNYVLSSDSGSLEFFTKPTASTAAQPVTLPGEDGPYIDVTHFFVDQLKQANLGGRLPAGACGEASTLPDLPDEFNPYGFDPKNVGCFIEVYDTRVSFDSVRKRFWIVSQVRNKLWRCDPVGVQTQPETIPGEGTHDHPICHTDWSDDWPRRGIVVAVSKTQNPKQGFHKYLLDMFENQDWPQFALHDHYLIVNHRSTPSPSGCACVFVFNAEQLADPTAEEDGSVFEIGPLATFPWSLFSLISGTNADVDLVQSHGGRRDLTYLWSPNVDHWDLFALWSRHPGNPTDVPTLLYAGSVGLDDPIGEIRSNAAMRNGRIWFGAHFCAVPNFETDGCAKYDMQLYEFSVLPDNESPPHFFIANIHARLITKDAKKDAAQVESYVNPAVEVTSDDDVVVVYERTGMITTQFTGEQDPPTHVRYLVWRHNAANPTTGHTLKSGSATPPDLDPDEGGVVDLGGAAVDPDGNTVWISHAFATDTSYRHVIGAVTP
jgi:hypothetical protein